MAVKRLINLNTNGTQQEYSGVTTSAGAGSADELPRLDSNGKLDVTFMPTGFGQDAIAATAGEVLSAGDFGYFSGTGTVLKADATAIAKQARGYVNSSVINGATATVFFDDTNTAKTGLTVGITYYIDHLTPGGITTSPSTTTGHIVQEVGFSTSATSLRVNIQEPVIRA
jgi:hypothetical protein